MTLVVDASVALKGFINEAGSDLAVSLLNSGTPMIAPDLVLAEVCNAAWKSLRRREIEPTQLDRIASDVAGPFQRLVPSIIRSTTVCIWRSPRPRACR